jgi:hypothetical protein
MKPAMLLRPQLKRHSLKACVVQRLWKKMYDELLVVL